MKLTDVLVIAGTTVTVFVCLSAVITPPPSACADRAPTASATATPPLNGSIRTWAADGHWWVVGDGWGQHHPGCPCHAKAEVE